MATNEANGTQAATVTTEHSLHVNTSVKVLQGVVDLANMVADDEVEVTVYLKAKSGGTKGLAFQGSYKHDQGAAMAVTPPVGSAYEWEMTLKQVAGTSRNFDWYVISG